MIGYCMHCKKKQSIKDRKVYKTRKNKYYAKGPCNECGRNICHMITKDRYEIENSFEQHPTI